MDGKEMKEKKRQMSWPIGRVTNRKGRNDARKEMWMDRNRKKRQIENVLAYAKRYLDRRQVKLWFSDK